MLTNQIGSVYSICVLFLLVVFYSFGMGPKAIWSIPWFFVSFLTFPLNHFGYNKLARVWILVSAGTGGLLYSSIFGMESRFYQGQYVVMCCAVLLFDVDELPTMFAIVTMATVYYLLGEWNLIPSFGINPIPPWIMKSALNLMTSSALIGCLLYFHSANEGMQKRLEAAVSNLKLEVKQRLESEEKIKSLHRSLVDASRRAGMAEVAVGVLHNVGNVLNSLNTSSEVVSEKLRVQWRDRLLALSSVLTDSEIAALKVNPERLSKLRDYVNSLATAIQEERDFLVVESDSIRRNVDHIKSIIAVQQLNAGAPKVYEEIHVEDLVSDSVKLIEDSFVRHGIRLRIEAEKGLTLFSERHKILQILVNLLGNSRDALRDSNQANKEVRISVQRDKIWVVFAVSDNGPGISESNLVNIFRYGFTTKKEGHGFGLHSSANAAGQLGGKLTCQSDEGQGATFTLRIPSTVADQVKAA